MKNFRHLSLSLGLFLFPILLIAQCEPQEPVVIAGPLTVNDDPVINQSCDGSVIAWVSGSEIAYSVNGGPTQIISTTSNNNTNPQVSCDGSTIAWFGEEYTKIFKVRLGEGLPEEITPPDAGLRSLVINCDGSSLAWGSLNAGLYKVYYKNGSNAIQQVFTSDNNFLVRDINLSCENDVISFSHRQDIYRSVSGEAATVIASIHTGTPGNIKVTCDGSTVFYSGIENGMEKIFRWSNNTVTIIYVTSSVDNSFNLDINCDGSILAFREQIFGNQNIFVSINGATPFQIQGAGTKAGPPSVSDNNTLVSWTNGTDMKIYVYDVESEELTDTDFIPLDTMGEDAGASFRLKMSGDGSSILYPLFNPEDRMRSYFQVIACEVETPSPLPAMSFGKLLLLGCLVFGILVFSIVRL